jgi:predicted RNase H-like HicB family nuclease
MAMKIAITTAMIEPGRWHSRCPSLPGCRVVGRSRAEVARKINLALRGYLASLDVAVPLEVHLVPLPV